LSNEEIGRIISQIQSFSPDLSQQEMRGRIIYRKQTRELYLASLGRVIDTIKEHLNTTMQGTQQNFSTDFTFQNAESLEIHDGQLIIKGTMKGTPISFFYDLATGTIATNTIIGEDKGVFHLNNDNLKTPLMQLIPFNNIIKNGKQALQGKREAFAQLKHLNTREERKASGQAIAKEALLPITTVKSLTYQKENFATMMEKNQTLQMVIQLFELDKHTTYTKEESPGIYHLLQILNNSITTAEEGQLMRKNIEKLARLINIKKHQQQAGNIEHTHQIFLSSTNELHRSDIYIDPLIEHLFNPEKIQQDQKDLLTQNSKKNGLYQFLKCFTKNISTEGTAFIPEQKLNIKEMETYLTTLEKGETYRNAQLYKLEEQLLESPAEKAAIADAELNDVPDDIRPPSP
jgi:hypothetical protein